MSAPAIDMEGLRARLVIQQPGARAWSLEWRKESDSTNACLLEEPPLEEWRVLATGWQRQGRGRRGRSWQCAPGEGLLVSLACLAPPGPGSPALLGHWAVWALLQALDPLCGPGRLWYKWPNDLLALDDTGQPRKLAGLLVQTQSQGARVRAVIGLGLNLEQRAFAPDLRQPATSLALLGVSPRDPGDCLARWLLALDGSRELLARPGELVDGLAQRDAGRGRPLSCEHRGRVFPARLLGYAPDGGIRLDTPEGEITFHDGELRLLPPTI